MKRAVLPGARQVVVLLNEIASTASDANTLCYHFKPTQDDGDHYELQIRMLRETIKRMGWMADLAAATLGASTTIGDAQAWLTPPAFAFTAEGEA